MKPADLLRPAARLAAALLLMAIGVGAQRIGLIDYFTDPYEYPYLLTLLRQHLTMVGASMAIATAGGIAIGIVASRPALRRLSGPIMYVVGLGQTIPSLAILALAMTVFGIGTATALVALVLYSLLPIARNTLAGLTGVRPALLDAARGMGMPPLRILWEVELPNAMPVILTGCRVALVINIGTTALAYLIGAGGLGDLIFTGISLMQPDKLLAGAIPTTLLALAGDFGCELAGLLLISRGLRLAADNQ